MRSRLTLPSKRASRSCRRACASSRSRSGPSPATVTSARTPAAASSATSTPLSWTRRPTISTRPPRENGGSGRSSPLGTTAIFSATPAAREGAKRRSASSTRARFASLWTRTPRAWPQTRTEIRRVVVAVGRYSSSPRTQTTAGTPRRAWARTPASPLTKVWKHRSRSGRGESEATARPIRATSSAARTPGQRATGSRRTAKPSRVSCAGRRGSTWRVMTVIECRSASRHAQPSAWISAPPNTPGGKRPIRNARFMPQLDP